MGIFGHVKPFPPDPVLGIGAFYKKDPHPHKVNLSVGVYYNEDLKPEVMRAVKRAEELLVEKETNKLYLPQGGSVEFIEESKKLIFGEEFVQKSGGRIFGAQSVGGTGALRLGGDFLVREVSKKLFISDPTWPNHGGVFSSCGMEMGIYPYYDREKRTFDCGKLLDFLDGLEEKSIVVLHGCCHNPTGCDPTKEEWIAIEEKMKERGLIPFFDVAYLGFSRNVEEDSWAIRHFAKKGHEFLVALSFSKSFSLYGERIGALFVLSQREEESANLGSVIRRLIRVDYSNPPLHGAHSVTLILQDKDLRKMWEDELLGMLARVKEMREEFLDGVAARLGSDDFEFLRGRCGMFSLLPLTEFQVESLMKKRSIYMTKDGRINLAGLSQMNLSGVVEAIVDVWKEG